jgi:hypothetical protein
VRIGSTAPDALRNVISSNRNGVVLRNGTTQIVNTTITGNSFDGIRVEGGAYEIGLSATRHGTSNVIAGNGAFGILIADGMQPANPQTNAPLRRIQGNFLGLLPDGSRSLNRRGNVFAEGGGCGSSRIVCRR